MRIFKKTPARDNPLFVVTTLEAPHAQRGQGVILDTALSPGADRPAAMHTELAFVSEFVCDGKDKSTRIRGHNELCREAHYRGNERIEVAQRSSNKVDVRWRRVHPLVAEGTAKPGAPFEAEDDLGYRIRVEARYLVSPEEARSTRHAISGSEMMDVKRQKGSQQSEAAALLHSRAALIHCREQGRNALESLAARLETTGSEVPVRIVDSVAQLVRANIEEALGRMEEAAAQELNVSTSTFLNHSRLEQLGEKFLTELEQALGTFELFRVPEMGVALEASFEALQAELEALQSRLDKAELSPSGSAFSNQRLQQWKKDLDAAQGRLLETAPAARELWKHGPPDGLNAEQMRAWANPRVQEGEVLKRALEPLQTECDRLRQAFAVLESDLNIGNGMPITGTVTIDTVNEDGALRWDVTFENQGSRPFVGTLSLARSRKNAGEGFESMAVPDEHWKATQSISSRRNHGITPMPGEVLRLQVRGHSFMELPLPAEGRVQLPLVDFEYMPALEKQYHSADYVMNKVAEKAICQFNDGTPKVQFFKDGERVFACED